MKLEQSINADSRRGFIQTAGSTILFGLTGCQSISSQNKTLTIGVLLPLSGPLEEFGNAMQDGIRIAKEEINSAGGPLNHEVDLEIIDTKSKPEKAEDGYQKLRDEHNINWIVGPAEDRIAIEIAKQAAADSVLLLSPSCVDPRLASLGLESTTEQEPRFIGRTAPNMVQQGVSMGYTLNHRLRVESAAFLVRGDREWPVAKRAANTFTGNSLQIVKYDLFPNQDMFDSLLQNDPDAIGYIDYPKPAEETFRLVEESGYHGDWVLTDSVLNPQILSTFESVLNGAFRVKPDPKPTEGTEAFRKTYSGGLFQFAAQAYDALYLHSLAIESTTKPTAEAAAMSLRSVSRPPGKEVSAGDFQQAKTILGEGNEVNYTGASSHVDLTSRFEPIYRQEVARIDDSSFQPVEHLPPTALKGNLYT